MGEYVARRALYGLLVIIFVAVFVFVVIRLIPGDPVRLQLMDSPGVTEEQVDQLTAELGLDQPLHTQLLTYFWNAAQGDFGRSFESDRPVGRLIAERLPITLQLGAMAIIIGILIGLPLGSLSAIRRGTWLDQMLRGVSVAGISLPNFWIGLLLVTYLAIWFAWSPPLSYQGPTENLGSNLAQMILPAVALSAATMASVARLLRSSLLEVMGSNYIRTVRAKGAPERVVWFKHALRNSTIPVFSLLGVQVGGILGGTVIIESIFSIPGMGRLIFDSVLQRDYPVILGCVVVYGAVFVAVNLVVDVLYGVIDPRIRYR